MQVNQISATNDFELSGKLASASGNSALFALFLAMQFQPGYQAPRFAKEAPSEFVDDLSRLNHYPRANLYASEQDYEHTSAVGKNIAQAQLNNAKLLMAMHPDPLAPQDMSKTVPLEVKVNCSYTTQMRLSLASNSTQEIVPDPTQLTSIIDESAKLLS